PSSAALSARPGRVHTHVPVARAAWFSGLASQDGSATSKAGAAGIGASRADTTAAGAGRIYAPVPRAAGSARHANKKSGCACNATTCGFIQAADSIASGPTEKPSWPYTATGSTRLIYADVFATCRAWIRRAPAHAGARPSAAADAGRIYAHVSVAHAERSTCRSSQAATVARR